jgi:hypothetical protein
LIDRTSRSAVATRKHSATKLMPAPIAIRAVVLGDEVTVAREMRVATAASESVSDIRQKMDMKPTCVPRAVLALAILFLVVFLFVQCKSQ